MEGSSRVTEEQLLEELADVSHATWLLQGIRDYGRTLADPREAPRGYKGTQEWAADVEKAQRMLKAVRDEGDSLKNLSPRNEEHWATEHDEERAKDIVAALKRLHIWPPS